jgi:hypothetical protein
MKHEIVPLQECHLKEILSRNESCGIHVPPGLTVASLLEAYMSPGSIATCFLLDGKPAAIGGVINLQWHRGEAWLLVAQDMRKHFRAILRTSGELLQAYAELLKLHRLQAVSYWNESRKLLTLFGFNPEGTLKRYGPQGEPAVMYARFFNE